MEETLKIGDKVAELQSTYSFPSTVIGIVTKLDGRELVICEMDTYGIVHIFNAKQLKKV